MTLWLADQSDVMSHPPTDTFPPAEPDVGLYRVAVSDLVAEIAMCTASDGALAEHVLAARLNEEPFTDILAATPDGWDATVTKLMSEVRNYDPDLPPSAASLASAVRMALLAQIEAVWWGREPSYLTDPELADAPQLVDLDELDLEGKLSFTYRHQATTLVARAVRSAQRRTLPGRWPKTAGLWLARARPRLVTWLNDVAEEFEELAPPGTPPLFVTSLARSITHQQRLRALGYVAPLPSAHCVGYAADIEMAWYRRFHAHRILRGLLLDRQRAGEVNVIDEGQAWHVCLRPEVMPVVRWTRQAKAEA